MIVTHNNKEICRLAVALCLLQEKSRVMLLAKKHVHLTEAMVHSSYGIMSLVTRMDVRITYKRTGGLIDFKNGSRIRLMAVADRQDAYRLQGIEADMFGICDDLDPFIELRQALATANRGKITQDDLRTLASEVLAQLTF
jgi:hypothetical protein